MPLMSPAGRLAAAWGVGGVSLLLVDAIARLGGHAWAAVTAYPLSPLEWAATALWCLTMVVLEGYRGFQRSFSPRVVARAWQLGRGPRTGTQAALAPLYCMSLAWASRRRLVVSWLLVGAVVAVVVLVRHVPQPLRDLIDLGVVLGLSHGVLSLWASTLRALLGR
jgi:hypothetical protein